MDSDLKNEDVLMRVRIQLNSEQIKLWQKPYYEENVGQCQQEIEALAKKYTEILKIKESDVLDALVSLQSHSIQRAKANDEFKETGVALLRLKVPAQQDGNKNINLQIKLDASGNELIDAVSMQLSIEPIRLKLIHQGRVVKRDATLSTQGIKNGAQILVVMLAESPEKLRKDADLYSVMQTARHDAELLSENADNDFGHYMQLEDQSGNTLKLPAAERKALTVAMTLHERGRQELKKDNYPLSLVLLLEADKHFSECNADILKSVDNYALLNLDIAWCYLNLGSITHIPDAEARLKRCEDTFLSTYGPKLERLIALKGSSCNEQALFARLHLLQGIVQFHRGAREGARALLGRAEGELCALRVDPQALGELRELAGCGAAEARLALRAAGGGVQAALEHVLAARDRREQARKRAREEQESRAMGKCANGQEYISAPFVKLLQEMGYPRRTAIVALKNSNNHISNAVRLIQEQPEMLAEDLSRSSTSLGDIFVDEQSLEMLLGLGFDKTKVKAALKECENQLDKAADLLINSLGSPDSAAGPSTSSSAGGTSGSSQSTNSKKDLLKKFKMQKEVKEAFERLSEGINTRDDDYLDLKLQQEEEFLQRYKDLLQ